MGPRDLLLLSVLVATSAFTAIPLPRTSSKLSVAVVEAVNGDTDTSETSVNIRLNLNEKAKTVASVCTSGTLCTISSEQGIEGSPFGSFVDYILDDEGNPIFLMNEKSMHTINVQNNPQVTLFCQIGGSEGQDVSRCSITGKLAQLKPKDPAMDTVRMRYSIAHAYADQVMDSKFFAFYRLVPDKVYFVGGFGVLAKWVTPEEYKLAAPDILAKSSTQMISRINVNHNEDLLHVARHLLNVENVQKVRLTSVDRLGMDVRVTSELGSRRNKRQTDEFRIGFRIPVISVEDAKSEILKVFQEAWEVANDFSWGDDDDESPGSSVPIMKIAADSLE